MVLDKQIRWSHF